jgi:hypothetical protein
MVLLLKAVMLETEWGRRTLYRFNHIRIADAFMAMIALPAVECEDLNAIAKAIGWMRDGLDFADASHLASAQPAGKFATFDRELVRRAANLAEIPIINVKTDRYSPAAQSITSKRRIGENGPLSHKP